MAAQVVKELPEGPDWLYELKFDGYRALLLKDNERVELRSRKNKDLTRMYPAITLAGKRLRAEQAVIDGEIVALDGEVARHSKCYSTVARTPVIRSFSIRSTCYT